MFRRGLDKAAPVLENKRGTGPQFLEEGRLDVHGIPGPPGRDMTPAGPLRPNFRKLAELSSIGLLLPSSIIVGLVFGYFLDRWLGTAPWLLLGFTVLGVVSGLMSLFKALRRYDRDKSPDE